MTSRGTKHKALQKMCQLKMCVLCLADIYTVVYRMQGRERTVCYVMPAAVNAHAVGIMDGPEDACAHPDLEYEKVVARLAASNDTDECARQVFISLDSEDFNAVEVKDKQMQDLLDLLEGANKLFEIDGSTQKDAAKSQIGLSKHTGPEDGRKPTPEDESRAGLEGALMKKIEDITRKKKKFLRKLRSVYTARNNQNIIMERAEEMRYRSKARYVEYLVEGIEYQWWRCKAMKECLVYANTVFTRVSLNRQSKWLKKGRLTRSGKPDQAALLDRAIQASFWVMMYIEDVFDYIDKVYIKKVNKILRIIEKIDRYIKLCISEEEHKECEVFVEVLSKVCKYIKDTLPIALNPGYTSEHRHSHEVSMHMRHLNLT
ncbi:hypothetical protein NERG_02621 [Nematocida ausubeli]|uniref:Uncharacterized protein n=1 Tax=Nematocida ausubeli (strain ATCC PRA-371 / ERTm2) TaxID=1913371 RepID=H8ZGA0_NEMA1|nr:hypothetical protein NERG_02621 [Nematocida ausubeli]